MNNSNNCFATYLGEDGQVAAEARDLVLYEARLVLALLDVVLQLEETHRHH